MGKPVPAPAPALPAVRFSRAEKASILLGLLGEDAAGPVFEGLDEASARRFVRAMAGLGQVGPDVVCSVVAEFLEALDMAEHSVSGGARTARQMVGRHLDKTMAERILDELDPSPARTVWKRLAAIDPSVLAELVAREHPQTAALILSRLPPEHAGAVLNLLEPETAQQVVMAVRRSAELPEATVDTIGESVSRMLFGGQAPARAVRPAVRLASIVNYAAGEVRDSIIGHLESTDPDFAAETRRSMFTFPDIGTRVRRQDVSAVVRAVEHQTLIRALAGATETAAETRQFILSNISSRMAEAIEEEIKEAGAVRRKDAEDAQNEVIKAVRRLEQAGEIKLVGEEE